MLTRDEQVTPHANARHVTHSHTTERINRMCSLIASLQLRTMTRAEIGSLLEVGPSGVRKYLSDLRGMVSVSHEDGEQVCRWTASADETRAYLARLASMPARPARVRSALGLAMRDPARHIHVMVDDEHFAVKVQRRIPEQWPVLAYFFNLVPGGVWARG